MKDSKDERSLAWSGAKVGASGTEFVYLLFCTCFSVLAGCCIELVLFLYQKKVLLAPNCVKRFSLEELCENFHDMVMWTFSCCLRGSRKKFLTVQR